MKKPMITSRDYDRCKTDARDLQRINQAAERLNAEAVDVLEYQADVPECQE
jgi:hypothetical protein